MYRLFLQDSVNDCGAACLATILRYHGLYVTPIDLVKRLALTRGGATNKVLQDLAAEFGLMSRVIRLPIESFHRLEEPCMAYIEGEVPDTKHLVIIFQVKGNKLIIGDPAKGKYTTTIEKFASKYIGSVMIFQASEAFEKGVISQTYLSKFLNFIKGYRVLIAKSLAIGAIASAIGFGMMYLSKLFVDSVLPKSDYNLIYYFVGAYFLARLLGVGIKGFNEIFSVTLKNTIHRVLSRRFFSKTLGLEKKHIDVRDPGDFMMLFSQIETLTQGIATYYSNFILVVFGMLVKAAFLVCLYDTWLASIILGIVALNSCVGFLFTARTSEHANRRGFLFSQINTAILNALTDIRVVRIFKAEHWVHNIYRRLLDDGLDMVRKITRLQVFGRSVAETFSIISEGAIFLICGYQILAGNYSIGDFLLFISFANSLSFESLQFPSLILNFQSQLRSFARVQAIFELSQEKSGVKVLDQSSLEVEFRNVTFAYPGSGPVLKEVNFRLSGGKTTAIVGESGSGKTTIMNLIMGFYQPQSGRILINGIDLNELDLNAYRDAISAVFQDTPIFNRSIYANVAFDNDEIGMEKVKEVAELLGINEFIEQLPETYKHLTYQGGLSGGQTQRLGILRAMVKPFRMLLLDEATSSLDSLTEERIVNGIAAIGGEHTTRMIIAHRLSTVMNADQIIVLKDGEVAEMGNHQSLIEQEGYYLALIQRQYEVNLLPSAS